MVAVIANSRCPPFSPLCSSYHHFPPSPTITTIKNHHYYYYYNNYNYYYYHYHRRDLSKAEAKVRELESKLMSLQDIKKTNEQIAEK